MSEENTLSFEEIERAVEASPCLEDLPDERDYLFDEIMAADDVEIPEEFSLRDQMTPVRNQGSRGTCVGFGSTAISEFYNAAEYGDPELDLSEEYLFRRIKEFDLADYNFDGWGAYMRSGAKALVRWGTCREETAPYNNVKDDDVWKSFRPTVEMNVEAADYRMLSYVSVPKIENSLKRALVTSKAPLLIGVTLYKSYREAKTNGGYVPVPKQGEERVGGHCMAMVGYTKTHMIFKNSWTDGWGDGGYIYWPWEAIGYMHSNSWSFVDLTTNPAVIRERVIEKNKERLLPHQVEAWEKGIKKGIVTEGTVPDHTLSKGDMMVFFDRLGLLD